MAASNGGALPVVDLAPFFAVGDADGEGARTRATEAVREACQATGFFRAPPLFTKKLARGQSITHGGQHRRGPPRGDLAPFFAVGDADGEGARTRATEAPAHSADKNEYLLLFNPKLGLNHYPAQPAGFRDALEECYAKLTDLGLLIQNILSECMGLPPGFLAEYNADRGFDFLTALHYLPATTDENNGISAHEDGNCITFVLQDGVGGLEVLGEDGRWVPAEPVEGSIVVNVGDVLQVLSNKKFKSATHRVVRRPGAHRHSIAFFLNLHGDKWVEPLPAFAADVGDPPRYRGFRYDEYMQLRMRNKTHPPSRPEDVIHITHYEI
ncbi:1-aminocyclopropane-1-carboxylate oxidase 1 [Triticum urartu]|uniref:1-aminocyclopropane-1-carboxylate oxidase 1 n=1 Tax=Triticum urartu TaxID=4572 RepID=M7YIM8_TRIUA|nr:1-aminocyclopropane-1-carboxylate oxidase 1 [Triticum urartu]